MTMNNAPTRSASTFGTIGIISGLVALAFFPPLFGIIGLVMGAIGTARKETAGPIALVISIVGMIVGMVIGAAVATNV